MQKIDKKLSSAIKSIANRLKNPICLYDLETSGVQIDSDEIWQFFCLRINPDGSSLTLEFKCKPSKTIHPEATKVHGVKNEDLKEEPPFSHFIDVIKKIFDGADIAGFNNIRFDDNILSRQMAENGIPDFLANKKSIDVYSIYKKDSPMKLANGLKFYCNEDLIDGHHASNDTFATAKIFAKQLDKYEGSPAEVFDKLCPPKADGNDRWIVCNDKKELILNFTKVKGTKVVDLESGLVSWLMKAAFIPKDVKKTIKDEYDGKRTGKK